MGRAGVREPLDLWGQPGGREPRRAGRQAEVQKELADDGRVVGERVGDDGHRTVIGPPQLPHTRTSNWNTRRRRSAHGSTRRRERREPAVVGGAPASGCGVGRDDELEDAGVREVSERGSGEGVVGDAGGSTDGSFDYLLKDSDIKRALRNIWIALKPNGIGILEIWNAIPIREIKKKPLTLISKINYEDKIIKRERGFKLLNYQDKTIVEVNYNYNISDEEVIDRHIMRAFTCNEFTNYLESNGFKVITFYANSRMDPFNEVSNRIIFHFKK